MSDVTKLPQGPPAPTSASRADHLELKGDDALKRDNIVAHFRADAYALNGTPLTEDEQFWLVRFLRCRILQVVLLSQVVDGRVHPEVAIPRARTGSI